jgi:hypothetical protein
LKEIEHTLIFQYKNRKGHFSTCRVDGNTSRTYYGHTEFHTEDQWLMEAFDLDKQEMRTFAMRDISNIV